jgi:hypothetical protein
MQQRDYLERLIEQIAAFLARIVGLTRAGKHEEAEREIDNGWTALGFRRADAHRLDDATLRMMLGPKLALAIELLSAEADLHEARGSQPLADMLRARITKLR